MFRFKPTSCYLKRTSVDALSPSTAPKAIQYLCYDLCRESDRLLYYRGFEDTSLQAFPNYSNKNISLVEVCSLAGSYADNKQLCII